MRVMGSQSVFTMLLVIMLKLLGWLMKSKLLLIAELSVRRLPCFIEVTHSHELLSTLYSLQVLPIVCTAAYAFLNVPKLNMRSPIYVFSKILTTTPLFQES